LTIDEKKRQIWAKIDKFEIKDKAVYVAGGYNTSSPFSLTNID
jgi:hypothetical protein